MDVFHMQFLGAAQAFGSCLSFILDSPTGPAQDLVHNKGSVNVQ